ncbi:FAD-dependent oxidoreductase, partial [candidate division KSB1 bacterium]|nr:FAD-dependent oxidoreductase [candidate division KSB1 bacterium]
GTTHYCLRRELNHPQITTIPGAKLTHLKGQAGDFSATIQKMPLRVKPELCINCGACVEVCPVTVTDEFNGTLTPRKAIYARYPLPIPNMLVIDELACTRCEACVGVCPTQAIDLNATAPSMELPIGAVILAAGFEEFDPRLLMQYGYRRYPDVLTSIELERMFSGYGAGHGDIFRPSNHQKPKNLAFLQCVGSRDHERDYCSAACCMYALKEAMIVREENPDLAIHFFYMDARAYGKGYHRFLEKARQDFQVHFTRSRIPVVKENPATKRLTLRYQNEVGQQISEDFDLVVLSIGQTPPPYQRELADILKLNLNQWGFCRTDEFIPVQTNQAGIFVCGAFAEPKDIPESIAQATAAALQAVTVLKSTAPPTPGSPPPAAAETIQPGQATYYDNRSETRDWQGRTAVFICECGGEISKSLNTRALAAEIKNMPHVVLCETVKAVCLATSLKQVTEKLKQARASRVVFAACVPYHYQHLFEAAAAGAGIEPGYVRLANIREHAAWPHRDQPAAALQKAKQLTALQIEFAQQEDALELAREITVNPHALVIGGGVAGLCAALGLANLGLQVDLVEQSEALGGHLRHLHFSLHDREPQELLQTLTAQLETQPQIQVRFNTRVQGITGQAGHFVTQLQHGDDPTEVVEYGALIVATGGQEHLPQSFEFGKHPHILTQQQFKEKVIAGEIEMAQLKQVVMIQCVESRTATRPYCSRICCTQAITNALKIKAAQPEVEIVIFNRDIMTYGFREQYYTQAREAGILFVRYEEAQPPQVQVNHGSLQVKTVDPETGLALDYQPDLLLLSSGIDPNSNSELARHLKLPLDADGFFQEAEVKFRPVDFHKDGIYLAGLAHSPRFLEESVIQGYAAAARAASILLKPVLTTSPLVAEVNARRCSGCEVCIPACVYDARVYDAESHTVQVRAAMCQGCGACAMVCPNNACKLKGYRDKQVLSVIDQALSVA